MLFQRGQEVQGLCALVLDITREEQHYRLPSAARMAELREQGRALAKSFGIPLGGLEPDGDQELEPQSQPEIEPETDSRVDSLQRSRGYTLVRIHTHIGYEMGRYTS
jgi:hypothetical protein